MPKILITGNGLDLSLGLPTHYNDFIEILNHIYSGGKLEFDDIYSKSINYKQLENDYNNFKINEEKIQPLRKLLAENLWFNFFRDEKKLDTWIDFENKIEFVLIAIFKASKYISDNIFYNGSVRIDDITFTFERINSEIDLFHILKSFKLIKNVNQHSFDFTILDFCLKKRSNFYTGINLQEISKLLYDDLLKFKKIFSLYFEIFVYPFYEQIKNKKDFSFLKNFHYHFTFNFTPTFEKLINKNFKTSFLHGQVNSDENKIVLGIDEIPENEINKRLFIPFTKYFQKLNNATDFSFLDEIESRKQDESYYFYFLGHSLDKSDTIYINEVFDLIKKSNRIDHRIYVAYHNEFAKSNLLINLLDIIGKDVIIDFMRKDILQFFEYSQFKDDSKDIFNQKIKYRKDPNSIKC